MTKTARFYLKPHDKGYAKLRAMIREGRAVYNSAVAVIREQTAYGKLQWALGNPDVCDEVTERIRAEFERVNVGACRDNGFNVEEKPRISGIASTIEKARTENGIASRSHSKVLQGSVDRRLFRIIKQGQTPGFKRDNNFTLDCNTQTIGRKKLKQGIVAIAGVETSLRLGDYLRPEQIKSARVMMDGQDIRVELIYDEIDSKPKERKPSGISAGIDLGVAKLVTVAFSNASMRPLVYDGSYLKHLNQQTNKEIARLKSIHAKLGQDAESRRTDAIWSHRNRVVYHEIRSIASDIVRQLDARNVDYLVIGWNDGFKLKPNLGKKNNQTFACLPLAKLRDAIIEKCREAGIEVEVVDESYSSKASFLDGDAVPNYVKGGSEHHVFSGRRVKRGSYVSANGQEIHADVNAAFNILKKGNRPIGTDAGIVVVPCGVTPIWRPR